MGQRLFGYTLYELVTTLALLAVLAGLAAPMIASLAANGRIRTEVDALFHAVHLARQESILRRQVVSLCPSTDGRACRPGRDWSGGWIMFSNLDRDEPPRLDPGEPVLRVHRSSELVVITSNRRGYTLRSTEKRATNGTLVVCDRASRVAPRALVISYTGRPRVARENSRGEPYSCAD